MEKFIMVHKEMGVYIGSFLGLGFWSKLDTADQDCATLFESQSDANAFVDTWETKIDKADLSFPAIIDDNNSGYVSKDLIKQYW